MWVSFLTEVKNETFAKHDAFTVGEVFDERREDPSFHRR